jgi:hypothetical protein
VIAHALTPIRASETSSTTVPIANTARADMASKRGEMRTASAPRASSPARFAMPTKSATNPYGAGEKLRSGW